MNPKKKQRLEGKTVWLNWSGCCWSVRMVSFGRLPLMSLYFSTVVGFRNHKSIDIK